MWPVTFLSTLIHTRSSCSPNADIRVLPEIVARPFVPTTTSERMRPDTPRRTSMKPVTVPIAPVKGSRWSLTANAERGPTRQARFGFVLVKSPGSQVPRRYGSGAPPHAFSLFSV